ncbi:MAG: hypothetical protein LC791_10345 [Acidobacteria bacterium]|nr:hypothetical protein [Acidobacteriota bacterium]
MRTNKIAVAAALSSAVALAVQVFAQQHQPGAKPDHMQHRFDDPGRRCRRA